MSQVRTKAALEIAVCAYQHRLKPRCQVCDSTGALRLHHIIRREIINDRQLVLLMPLVLHALICDRCNNNEGPFIVDNPEGRAIMLAANADIFGLDQIISAFAEWDAIVPNGHNDEIVSLERVKEIYHARLSSTRK